MVKLSPEELDRYARQILLGELGVSGQGRLHDASVLVVGAGGLGSPVLLYLAAAGVGRITVVDDDRVSLSNLQRQVLYRSDDVGMPKVAVAKRTLNALNPFVGVTAVEDRFTEENAARLVAGRDLVIDGCDNFATRYLINRACVAAEVPLLSGAISQWEGQLSLFDPARGAPCRACVFPTEPAPARFVTGVMGALPGTVGAMMATEAIKELAGAGRSLRGRLLILDTLWGENREIEVRRNPACPVCGHLHGGAAEG